MNTISGMNIHSFITGSHVQHRKIELYKRYNVILKPHK